MVASKLALEPYLAVRSDLLSGDQNSPLAADHLDIAQWLAVLPTQPWAGWIAVLPHAGGGA